MKTSPINSGHYHAFFRREGSQKLLILFSHLGRRPPSFAWYKMAADLESNILFLNSEGQDWYRAGIPSLTTKAGIRHTLDAINAIAKSVSPNTQIYAAGASMGGYGALLYGSLLNASGIFACAAETILGIPGGRSSALKPNRWSTVYPDLRVLPPSKSNKYVVFGEMHLVDTLCAANLRENSNITMFSVPSGDHGVSDTLAARGQLLPSLQSLIDGNQPLTGIYNAGLVTNPNLEDLWHLSWLMESKDYQKAIELATSISKESGSHPLLSFLAGLSLFHLRQDDEAIEYFESTLIKAADFAPLYLYIGAIHVRNQKLEEGIMALRRSISIDPKPSLTHFQLGIALEKAEAKAEAANCFRQALKINPSHPLYLQKATEYERSTW